MSFRELIPCKRLKDMLIIDYIDINIISPHRISSTLILLPMSYLNLNNDVKSIIAKHLSSNYKISTMLMSKHYHLQKSLFGEIVFDHNFHKIKPLHGDINDDDDDFNNANIYTISNILTIFYILVSTYV
jgi:hypothetical protein